MTTLIALAALTSAFQGGSILQYTQPDLQDATLVARVEKARFPELAKINKDYGSNYRFDSTTIRFKEPFKLRLDAKVEDTTVVYVLNGVHQMWHIRGITAKPQNLSRSPGKRQTPLDFGILTPSLFDGLFEARFVRNDRATGCPVFDLTYPEKLDDSSRHRIWIDPQHKIVFKREWYNQSGRLLATFEYSDPRKEDGVWLPTRVSVRNVDGVVAGVTRYESIKVNTGLSESLFKVQ